MSNRCRGWSLTLLLPAAVALLLAVAPVRAQEPPSPAAGPTAPVAWSSLTPMQQKVLSRFGSQWSSLPPARQQALVHGSERWLGMSTDQRDQARERFQHFQSLPPEQRHALRSRWEKFQSLPPHEQARVRENFHKFQQLPPERRQMLREQWHNASPAQRQEMIQHAREQRQSLGTPQHPPAERPAQGARPPAQATRPHR